MSEHEERILKILLAALSEIRRIRDDIELFGEIQYGVSITNEEKINND